MRKIGEVVMVRQDLQQDVAYGGLIAIINMIRARGCGRRITEVGEYLGKGIYKISGSDFSWTEEMFEDVKFTTAGDMLYKTPKELEFSCEPETDIDHDSYFKYFLARW